MIGQSPMASRPSPWIDSSTFLVLEELDLFKPFFCLLLGLVRPTQVLAGFLREHTVTARDLFNHGESPLALLWQDGTCPTLPSWKSNRIKYPFEGIFGIQSFLELDVDHPVRRHCKNPRSTTTARTAWTAMEAIG